jgi:polyisoprenoid-binding protein YceI
MKKVLLSLLVITAFQVNAQKYLTKSGTIDFLSKAPLETIEGVNKSVAALVDAQTGSLDFIVQIKSFVFDRQLLQEHFNENYMESTKFPKATFKGNIENMKSINLTKDGEYDAITSGKLTIHGVTKDVKQKGKLLVKGGKIVLISNFSVLLADYNISIPGAVKDKISKDVKVNVKCTLDPIK